jgi:hypothetical protein
MSKSLLRHLRRFSFQGSSPESIALSISLGFVLGVFPCYGAPTLLCIGAAFLFRPHVPLLHAINAVTSPLQLALLVPFHTVGARIFPKLAGQSHLIARISGAIAQTSVGWLVVCLPAGAVLYLIATGVFRRCEIRSTVSS